MITGRELYPVSCISKTNRSGEWESGAQNKWGATYKLFIHSLFNVNARRLLIYWAQEGAREDMSTQEVFVQQFERLFHHYREALSPEAEQESSSWNSVPPDERNRLVAAARLAILELDTNAHVQNDSRRYFAKPGEAEWGC